MQPDQQLKEEPSIFVCIFSADSSADDHLQRQLLVKLLQRAKYANIGDPSFGKVKIASAFSVLHPHLVVTIGNV